MQIYKLYLLSCISVLAAMIMNGQQKNIGDQLQDVRLNKVVFYSKSQVSLSDFKGKNIILDLWAKGCAVCIKSFPKLVALQKKYGDKLQIIAVNSDSKEDTKKILEKQHIPNGIIPFITEDKTISKLFPRNYNPWVVWIDSSGIVRHISDGEWVSDENISLFINGQEPKLEENIFIKKPATTLPLFVADSGKWKDRFVYYSYLSHCIKGITINNLTLIDSNQNFRVTRNCKSATELFQDAFAEGVYNRFAYKNKVILHLSNPYAFIRPKIKDTAWINRYSYNYEISGSSIQKQSIYKMMQDDLQRVFGISVEIKHEKIPCLLLIRTDSIDHISTKGGPLANNLFDEVPSGKIFARNTPFSDFVYRLQGHFNPHSSDAPFIDLTGYKGNIDIQFDKNVFEKPDLSFLKQALKPFGLDIVLRDFETEVLVITEN